MLLVTAVEHIVNEVLTYKMEETGLDDAGIEKGLWAKFPHKIGKLWTRHLGTPMDPDLQATIHAAVDRRNEFVHMRVDRRPVAYPEECALRMGVEDELLERLTAGVGKLQAIRRESVFRGFDREVFVMEISELLRRRQA